MKIQTTLITVTLLLCLALLAMTPGLKTTPGGTAAAQSGNSAPPPQTKVCGLVTEFQAATAAANGAITIGGVRFVIAAGTSLNGFAVGANVCATFCFNAQGQIASVDGVAANAGPVQICGIVSAFDPYVSIQIGGAKLPLVIGTYIQGQTLIAVGVNMCLTPVYDGTGKLTFGTTIAEAPNTLPIRFPALVEGHKYSDESPDLFQMAVPLVLNVETPVPAGVMVTPAVGPFFIPFYSGYKAQGIYSYTASTPNSVTRASNCTDIFTELYFHIAVKGDTVDDMVTLSLQKPDGSGKIVLAMFQVAPGGAGVKLTQLDADVVLKASAMGVLKVGDFIPFQGANDGTGRTPVFSLMINRNSTRLAECLRYIVELKRDAWQGMISIIHLAAMVKRFEIFGDHDGSTGESILTGDQGWYPTGRFCPLACNACLPPPPEQPQPGSLSGFVYCDTNNNGIKEAGEAVLSGITITLTGTDINGPVNKNTTTDGNGFYIFKDLMPGVYKITETQPAGVNDGLDTVGTLGGDTTNDMFANIPLPSLGQGTNYNFGELCAGSTPTPTPTPTPTNSKCDTVCWRATQWFLNNSRNWPGGTVLAAGFNANNPMSIQGNLAALRNVLQGGPSAQQRLNREFVTAQMSLALAGGSGSPVVFNVFWSPLHCSQVSFSAITMSNGMTFTPDTLLDTLMNETVLCIRQNRQQDYDELANMWSLLNGQCGF